VGDKYIGLQIKPAGYEYISQIIKEREQQKKPMKNLLKNMGARFFILFP
jgi:hypothetical protein